MSRNLTPNSRIVTSVGMGILLIALAGCGAVGAMAPAQGRPGGPSAPGVPSVSSAPTVTAATTVGGAVSLAALPLGDGKVSSTPQVGYVDACQSTFNGRPGAPSAKYPWIHGSTWDANAKITLQGHVTWPQAANHITIAGNQRFITTNDLPVGLATGSFPIASSDPAYQYDRNPNAIQPQSLTYTLTANPQAAATPSCVPMGPIGVLLDGVILFNALDAAGHDAVAHEVQDNCGGHPQQNGMYHDHEIPQCLLRNATGSSTLVGYALDGFGIYVERDAQGNLLTNADLDACHGRVSVVTWNGKQVSIYHYVATEEYPYTVGCFVGAPVR